MKKADECSTIEDVREAIDQIDNEIITLLSRRALYVEKAAEYKTSSISVRAEDRIRKMLVTRRSWAVEKGINPDFIESMYAMIVDFFVSEEMKKWKSGND
ncbi:MAG TPA: chorismate mutase [Spirochaetota bacterium]